MSKNKIIRGKPIYVFRGSQYLEMPGKTFIKSIDYDERSNKSTVYCKRRHYVTEVICLLIALCCAVINVFYIHNVEYEIRYNSSCTYYNGYLYLNVYNDEQNPFDLSVSVLDGDVEIYEDTLSPGAVLIMVAVDDVKERYVLLFKYKTALSTRTEKVQINVIRKED